VKLTVLAAWLVLAGAACGADLKVMSFNIRYGTAKDGDDHWDRRKAFLVETIQKFDPDLLGTQETLAFQRDFLKTKLAAYTPFGVGRDDGKDQGEMAALFFRTDRFEKLEGGHFWLSDTPATPGSKGWDAALPRVASWVKLKDKKAPDAKPVLFLNTHFDHRGLTARTESAKLIRKQVDVLGKGAALVVTGDFNAGEASGPYKALFDKSESGPAPVIDTFRTVHLTAGKEEGTFNGFKPTAVTGPRIDWIACSRDWKVTAAAIDRAVRDGRVPSDHFPVTAVLAR